MTPTIRMIPASQIIAQDQPRKHFDAERLRELAESIKQVGLLEPIQCRFENGLYPIINGGRRFRALTELLGATELPVHIVDEALGDADICVRQVVSNTHRDDLNPVERATAIHELVERHGLTLTEAAERLTISLAAASKSMALLKLPPEVLEQVATGALASEAGYQLSQVRDPEEQRRLAAEVTGQRLSRDALTRKLKRLTREVAGRTPAKVTAALGGGRSVTLAGGGLTLDSMLEWLDQLLARARKAKQQGLTLETFVRTLRDQAQRGLKEAK